VRKILRHPRSESGWRRPAPTGRQLGHEEFEEQIRRELEQNARVIKACEHKAE
jgi:hypothetical protein